MGGAIARNLLSAGFAVRGFDIDEQRIEQLEAAGGEAAPTAAAVAAADVVLTSLPSDYAFEAAVGGDDGLAAGARPGLVVIETSTLTLEVKQRAHDRLAASGATLLDCPLSGTGDQARNRDLVVMASGDRRAVQRCIPVFEGFARANHYLGPFGAGTKLKLVANLLVGIHNVAAAEALALAQRAGLDLATALEILIDGAGNSRMLEVRGPKMLQADYGSGVRTSVFLKDVDLISAFAAGHGVPTPLFSVCADLYRAALAEGHAEDDTASIYEVVRSAAAAASHDPSENG